MEVKKEVEYDNVGTVYVDVEDVKPVILDNDQDVKPTIGIPECENEEQTKTGRHIQCPDCDFTCKYNSEMERHKVKHTRQKPKMKKVFSCPDCDYKCGFETKLEKHMYSHGGIRPFSCSECGKGFVDNATLRAHLRTHDPSKAFTCPVCGYATPYKSNINKHILTHSTEKRYQCTKCDYKSADKDNLKKHMRAHSVDKPHKCTLCDYTTAYKGNIRIHMKSHRSVYNCVECNVSYKDQRSLDKHLMIHTGEAKLICEICKQSFETQGKLNSHMVVHSEEKPFSCSICKRSYRWQNVLTKHMLTHGERDYACSECDYTCTGKDYLRIHMKRQHNCVYYDPPEIPSPETNNTTLDNTLMQLSDNEGKDFACSECDYKCTSTEYLRIHMKISHESLNNDTIDISSPKSNNIAPETTTTQSPNNGYHLDPESFLHFMHT